MQNEVASMKVTYFLVKIVQRDQTRINKQVMVEQLSHYMIMYMIESKTLVQT